VDPGAHPARLRRRGAPARVQRGPGGDRRAGLPHRPRGLRRPEPPVERGRTHPTAGRVCMDQIVLACGDDPVAPGDVATLFGPGRPSADDWAEACGTINYEIVTRFGGSRGRGVYEGGGAGR